ncbi:hypothetical protein V8E36_009758 [Tilletia maclaganii]
MLTSASSSFLPGRCEILPAESRPLLSLPCPAPSHFLLDSGISASSRSALRLERTADRFASPRPSPPARLNASMCSYGCLRSSFLESVVAVGKPHRATCAKMSSGSVVQQPTAGSLLIVSPSQSLSCLCSPSHRSLEGALKHCDLQSRSPQAPGKPQVRLTLCSRLQPWSGDADAVLRECPHGAHRHRSPCPHMCSIMHHPLLTSDGFSGV